MADLGNPTVTFGTTILDSDDCLQVASFTSNGRDITYLCGTNEKHVIGPVTTKLSGSIAIAATDTAKVAAFAVGTTGIAEYHPGGDAVGNIEHTTTKASCLSFAHPNTVNDIIKIDFELTWDDLTSGAAT